MGGNKKKKPQKAVKKPAETDGSRTFSRRGFIAACGLLGAGLLAKMFNDWAMTNILIPREKEKSSGAVISYTRSDYANAYCLSVSPMTTLATPGTIIPLTLRWFAFHRDCPLFVPYNRTVEAVKVNTKIALENLTKVSETEWTPVKGLLWTFEKIVTVKVQNRNGKLTISRQCPWYFAQTAISHINVPKG